MNDLYEKMKADASVIYLTAIEEVKPDKAVRKAIASFSFPKGRLFLIAVGKAAWQMARTAAELIQPYKGIVISKYDHILKPMEGIDCYEAGHPILDENGIRASEKVLELVSDLNEDDGVLFLLSGGASALFEVPLIGLEELQDINRQLLASGANIIEINTIRKRLSKVKGGRFGKLCAPAKVYAVDVGYGQLAWKLRSDERVVNLERTNLRYVTPEQIPEKLDLAVMDVSFISIRLVLPAVKALLKDGADLVCLIKPQFEAGRDEVGKKGVVRDEAVHREVVQGIVDFAPTIGLSVLGLDYSPIKGPEGNIEYICHMINRPGADVPVDIAALVARSHEML